MGRYAKFFSLGGGGGTNNLQLPVGTILDATLRQVQDGTGTGSPLYLSTGGLRVGTTAGSAMYWDNTNSRLGIGTSAPSAPLQVIGITDIARFGTLTNYWRFNTNYGADQSLEMVNQGGGGTNTYYNTKLLNETYQTKLLIGEYQNYLSFGKYDNHRMVSLFNNGNFVIGSSTDLNAKLGVRGSGSTSATTSLLVQNSSAVDLLKLQDNGVLTLGTVASGLGKIVVTTDPSYGIKSVMENNSGGQIIRQVSTDVIWFGGQAQTSLFATGFITLGAPYIFGNNYAGNTTASSFTFRVSGSPYGQTPSTASRGVLFDGQLAFQSGGYANYFELSPTYSFDISNNRIVKGIYYNPTLVTPNTNDRHIAIETVTGDVLFGTTSGNVGIGTTTPVGILHLYKSAAATRLAIDGDAGQNRLISYRTGAVQRFGLYVNNTAESGANAGSNFAIRAYNDAGTLLSTPLFINRATGNVGVNTLTGTAKLQVVGSGSTSATTSLLVQNSGGADALRVSDNLNTTFYGAINLGNGNTIISQQSGNLRFEAVNSITSDIRINPFRQVNINNGNTYTAQASAILQVDSTTKGFLPPVMTTTQKNAIASPANGLMVYDTDLARPCFFNGATWITL
jgi:hypothetical protein